MKSTQTTKLHSIFFTRQIALFLLVCFGFSWSVAAVIWQTGGLHSSLAFLLLVVYMFGPAIAAITCACLFDRKRWKQALGFTSWPKWIWFGGLVLAIMIVIGSTLISLLGLDVHWIGFKQGLQQVFEAENVDIEALPLSLDQLVWLQILINIPVGIAINSFLLLNEELGWRGWLFDRWRPLGFWRGNLMIGFVWGLWHAPVIAMGFNYPELPIAGIFLMIGFTLLISPIIGWLREAGRSVFAASIFHGTINALAGVGLMVINLPDMPWRGMVGIGGFVMLATVCLMLLVLRRD